MPTYALSLLGREAHDQMAAWLPQGLRLGHLAVLGALTEDGARTQRELSELLKIHPSDMVTLVDDLAQRDLISRTTDPADRRRNLITLTTSGSKLVRQATTQSRRIHRELLSVLSRGEQESVRQLLDRALG
jgi:MarR family transcriptional regulator, lower aerobic nicotinate degradation pathway regulator